MANVNEPRIVHTGSNMTYITGSRMREQDRSITPIVKEFEDVGLRSLIEFEDMVNPRRMQEVGRSFRLKLPDIPREIAFRLDGQVRCWEYEALADLMLMPHEGVKYFSLSTSFSRDNVERLIPSRSDLLHMLCNEEDIPVIERHDCMIDTQFKEEIWPYYVAVKDNLTCRSLYEDYVGLPPSYVVMLLEALVVYWIKIGVPVDLSHMCFKFMEHASFTPNVRWPYGMRWSRVFRSYGYDRLEEYRPVANNPMIRLYD